MALRISDLGTAPTVEETDLVEIAEVDGESPSGYSSYKTTILGIANKIATSTVFSGLVTTAKNIVGAINEIVNGFDNNVIDVIKDLKQVRSATITDGIATFNYVLEANPLVEATATFSPKQSGTGDPSPTNIRPISGWDGLNLKRTGKNLFGGTPKYPSKVINSDGSLGDSNSYDTYEFFGKVKYIFSYIAGSGFDTIRWARLSNVTNTWTRYTTTTNPITMDVSNYRALRISIGKTDFATDIQLEIGETATAYEPYQGETYPATFTETIYGGSYDFVSGEGSETWGYIASYDGETLPGIWISDRDVYAEGTTPTTGAEVAYELATPTPIEITGQEIEALEGVNVVTTDGDGMSSVKYKKMNL